MLDWLSWVVTAQCSGICLAWQLVSSVLVSLQPATSQLCMTSWGEIEGIDDTPKKRFHPSLVEFLGVILIN